MFYRLTAVGALIVILAPAARAQDSYTLKLKEPAQGDSYLFKINDSIQFSRKIIDNQGNSQKATTDTRSKSFVYVETIVEKLAGKTPTSLRREFQKAQVTWNDKAQTLPMEGKAVLIEKKDDSYKYRLETGVDLSQEEIAELDLDFNKRVFNFLGQDVLPAKPVKVKESWTLDPASVLKAMNKEESRQYDLKAAKMTATLERVYDKEKTHFGVVNFRFELPLAAGVEPARGFKIVGGKMVIEGTFDGCIDGTSFARTVKATMSVDLRGYQEDNLQSALVALSVSGTLEQSWEDAPKAKDQKGVKV
jgi:hypothetical protein